MCVSGLSIRLHLSPENPQTLSTLLICLKDNSLGTETLGARQNIMFPAGVLSQPSGKCIPLATDLGRWGLRRGLVISW